MKKLLSIVIALSAALLAFGQSSAAVELPPQAATAAEERTHGPDGLDLDPRGRVPGAPYAVDGLAPWSPDDYDGQSYSTDVADVNTHPAFHAIYIYPKDKPSRFNTYAAMFQADARDASSLLTTQYGRAIRFDERPSSLSSKAPVLDITVFKSSYTSKQLATTRQFNLIAGELAGVPDLNKSSKKYIAWLDTGSRYCGQGNLSQDTSRSAGNQNEGKTLALVYRPYVSDANTGGFCRGRTLRHELGHTMGALQSGAPNAFDGAHCNDSAEDTMCYTSATTNDTGGPDFDYNNDDYWDPAANPNFVQPTPQFPLALAWWTVNLSSFICPPSQVNPSAADCTQPNAKP